MPAVATAVLAAKAVDLAAQALVGSVRPAVSAVPAAVPAGFNHR